MMQKVRRQTKVEEEVFDIDKLEVTFMNKPISVITPCKKREVPRLRSAIGEGFKNVLPNGYQHFAVPSVTEALRPRTKEERRKELNRSSTLPVNPCRTLVRGKYPLKHYNDVKEFPLYDIVKGGLKDLRITQINALQRSCWPNLFRGRNTFIVGGSLDKQGKTLSYLVPIAAKVVSEQPVSAPKVMPHLGAVGIILCSSSKSAAKIQTQLDLLVKPHCLSTYRASKSDPHIADKLIKNPDFLICKPDFLLYALDKPGDIFTFKRLRFLVVDDAHILLENNIAEVQELLERLSHEIQKTEVRSCPLQFIFCGQTWTDQMMDAYDVFQDPILVIGAPLQAMVYGNVNIKVVFLDDEEDKLYELSDILKRGTEKRFVVVCQNREVITQVATKLSRSDLIHPRYISGSNEEEGYRACLLNRMRDDWREPDSKEILVILVTDVDLEELNLNNVKTIINIDMPERKGDAFGDRHMCMWNLFPQFHQSGDNNELAELTSYVFLTRYEPELFKIVRHLKALNADISQDLEQFAKEQEYDALSTAPICNGIKLFGKCNNVNVRKCANTCRHFFTKDDFDVEPTIPSFMDGRVELQIIRCFELNYYQARVLYFYQVKDRKKVNLINYIVDLRKRHIKLTKSIEENGRKELVNPLKRCYCAVEFSSGDFNGFTRAKVVDELEYEKDGFPIVYRVWCVDTGEHRILTPNRLMELPDEFVDLPNMVISVIIADMKPIGDEENFRPNVGSRFSGNVTDTLKDEQLTARVALSIDDTIWVKSMYKFHRDSDEFVQDLNVRTDFLQNKCLGEDNPDHLATLYRMCEDQGFSCSMYEAFEVISPEFHVGHKRYEWAYLPICAPENPILKEAFGLYVPSPDRIFVVQDKFIDLLDSLVDELNDFVSDLTTKKYSDYDTKFRNVYEEGLCVSALDVDDRWARAIILKANPGGTSGSFEYDVFFVDHGDQRLGLTTKDLFPLPKSFLERLPFQAIAIRLSHVEPIEKGELDVSTGRRTWSKEAIELLQGEIVPDGEAKLVDVIACSKNEVGRTANLLCNCYDGYIIRTADIGEMLVDKGYANKCEDLWNNYQISRRVLLDRMNAAYPDDCDDDDDDVDESSVDDNRLISSDFKENLEQNDMDDQYDVSIPKGEELLEFMRILGIPTPPSLLGKQENTEAVNASKECTKETEPVAHCSKTTERQPTKSSTKSKSFPDLPLGKKYPLVQWSQKGKSINLKICVPDIKKYDLTVGSDKRTLTFETYDPPNYVFKIQLWAKVLSSRTESMLGQYLLIKLQKLSTYLWPNISEDKHRWLKMDMDKLDTSSGDEEDADKSQVVECAHSDSDDGIPDGLEGDDDQFSESEEEALSETEDLTEIV